MNRRVQRLYPAWLLVAASACAPQVRRIGTWQSDAAPADEGSDTAAPSEPASADAAYADHERLDASPPGYVAYLEAEDGDLSGGFATADDPTASGTRCLISPSDQVSDEAPGDARAGYTFTLPEAGTYVIWGRIYSFGATDNRFWFRVDQEPWYKWRISVGDIWFWDALHDNTNYGDAFEFTLAAGIHTITVANCVPGAKLDRLYITSAGDTPPGNNTPCNPPHTIERAGQCVESCGDLGGNTCDVVGCSGRTILVAYDCDVCCYVAP